MEITQYSGVLMPQNTRVNIYEKQEDKKKIYYINKLPDKKKKLKGHYVDE